MNYEFQQSPFSKAVLTGVFVGFASTVFCLFYDLIFRESTGYKPADFINVSSLIFAINLIFLVIGILYYIFSKSFKKGDLIFSILFVLLTIFFVWRADSANMQNDHLLTMEFRQLLIGIILILGIGAAFFVPFLFHNKKFGDFFL